MSCRPGDPFKAELSNADITTETAVPIYKSGSVTAHTLAADEYLEIDSYHVVTLVAADVQVFLSENGTESTGEAIVKGEFAANGGASESLIEPERGLRAATIWAHSDTAGQVDVIVRGRIRKEGANTGARPSWRESQIPGA
jgi:hypothetical protein